MISSRAQAPAHAKRREPAGASESHSHDELPSVAQKATDSAGGASLGGSAVLAGRRDSSLAQRIGRPRSARAHEAIIDAILELISEGMSVDALSIEAVAARAGVGKATIYRRWPNKQAMLADAIKELKGPPPQPTGKDIRERLISLLSKVSTGDERAAKIFPCLLPEIVRSETAYELWQGVIEPRREVMREVLRQGIADGELRADIDIEVVAATLTGPVLASRMMRWNPRLDNDALPAQVVDTVLAGIKSPS